MNTKDKFGDRVGALAAMAGGAAWIATGALHLMARDDIKGEAVDDLAGHLALGLLATALVLTAPGVLALARRARDRRPAYVAVTGMLILATAATVANIVGEDPLFFLVAAPLGNLLWFAGSVGLAVSLRRAGAVSKTVAIGLPLVQFLALPLSVIGGPLLAGAYWVAVGYLLDAGDLRGTKVQPAT